MVSDELWHRARTGLLALVLAVPALAHGQDAPGQPAEAPQTPGLGWLQSFGVSDPTRYVNMPGQGEFTAYSPFINAMSFPDFAEQAPPQRIIRGLRITHSLLGPKIENGQGESVQTEAHRYVFSAGIAKDKAGDVGNTPEWMYSNPANPFGIPEGAEWWIDMPTVETQIQTPDGERLSNISLAFGPERFELFMADIQATEIRPKYGEREALAEVDRLRNAGQSEKASRYFAAEAVIVLTSGNEVAGRDNIRAHLADAGGTSDFEAWPTSYPDGGHVNTFYRRADGGVVIEAHKLVQRSAGLWQKLVDFFVPGERYPEYQIIETVEYTGSAGGDRPAAEASMP